MAARVGEMLEPCSSNRPTKLPQADWTVYYDVQNKAKRCSTKDDFLKLITTAGTCQDRGSLDKIMSANRIEPKDATKVNFRCFRCDVQPIWEVFAILSVPGAFSCLPEKRASVRLTSAPSRLVEYNACAGSCECPGRVGNVALQQEIHRDEAHGDNHGCRHEQQNRGR